MTGVLISGSHSPVHASTSAANNSFYLIPSHALLCWILQRLYSKSFMQKRNINFSEKVHILHIR